MLEIDNGTKEFLNICDDGILIFNLFKEKPYFILKENNIQEISTENIDYIFFTEKVEGYIIGGFIFDINSNLYETILFNNNEYKPFIEKMMETENFDFIIFNDDAPKKIAINNKYNNQIKDFLENAYIDENVELMDIKNKFFNKYPKIEEIYKKKKKKKKN